MREFASEPLYCGGRATMITTATYLSRGRRGLSLRRIVDDGAPILRGYSTYRYRVAYRGYTPPLVGAHYPYYDGSIAAAAAVMVNIVVFAPVFY